MSVSIPDVIGEKIGRRIYSIDYISAKRLLRRGEHLYIMYSYLVPNATGNGHKLESSLACVDEEDLFRFYSERPNSGLMLYAFNEVEHALSCR